MLGCSASGDTARWKEKTLRQSVSDTSLERMGGATSLSTRSVYPRRRPTYAVTMLSPPARICSHHLLAAGLDMQSLCSRCRLTHAAHYCMASAGAYDALR